MASIGEEDRLQKPLDTGRGGGDVPTASSRKSVSLAKTMRPGQLAVVPRKALFERIDAGIARGGVWVAGPPGAGKTTLVSSYLERRRLTHLWYQVDRGDVDAATFFYYLGLAAAREPFGEGDPLPSFAPGLDVEGFSRGYFRELYRRLASPFALVFDNYQEAPPQSPLPLIVSTALAEIPRGGTVIVVSRGEPPRELARLRANQRIEVIGWSDLRLTPEELQNMARVRGQSLGDDASRSLHRRTQGWAAGAVLMLEHAKVMGVEAEPPADETPQAIFDYVAGEIFDDFEPTTRDFLLSTACMPQLTAEMAARVSGYSKAGALLTNLARNNYFVTERRVDGERVYQFHRLLGEFLRARARDALGPDDWARLARRSGRLLAEAGRIDEAVSLLLDEAQWEQAAGIVVAHADEILAQGRAETLMSWLDALPASLVEAEPWATYWQGAVRRADAPRAARRFYERAYEEFRAAPRPAAEGMVLACCGIVDVVVGELDDFGLLDPWIDRLDALCTEHGDALPAQAEYAAARSMLTALLLRGPSPDRLAGWIARALQLCDRDPEAAASMHLQPTTAIALMWAGRHGQAPEPIAATPSQRGWIACAGAVSRLLAGLATGPERGDGDASADAASGDGHGDGLHPACRALAALNDGALPDADTALEALASGPGAGRRLERGLYHYLRAWSHICRGDRLDAYHQVKTALGIATEIGSPGFELLCRLAWAETLSACGDRRRADTELRRAAEMLADLGNPLFALMAGLTRARVALDAGRADAATAALSDALPLGRRHGFTRSLWWRPESMAELCGLALTEGIEVDYVCHLIRSRGLVPDTSTGQLSAWPWPFQIFTLGKFRLVAEGTTRSMVSRGSKRPLELLKVLVAMGGRDVRTEHLADTLWPHKDGDYAYGSLTSALHRLRRLLGIDDAILLQEGRMSLNPRYVWVDTWAVDRLLADAERDVAITVGGKSMVAVAERLLEHYRGAFLEDELETSCYTALREHLRGRVLRLLNKIARHATRPADVDTAARLFERTIDADPRCEDLYRGLVVLFADHGRRTEALDVYHRCRSMLASKPGATPSREMTALYDKLCNANPVS